jgi:hypothetical protein
MCHVVQNLKGVMKTIIVLCFTRRTPVGTGGSDEEKPDDYACDRIVVVLLGCR